MNFLAALAARSQQSLRRVFIRVALVCAGALSAAVGLGFATYALFEAWRLQYGAVQAAVGLGVIYFVLAGVLFLCLRLVGPTRPAKAVSGLSERLAGDAATLKSAAQASRASEAAALAMGVEVAKQLTPLQLVLLAALSGFMAGRKL